VRETVSKNLLRFRTSGFDLNLVYVTPRVIAMGFPASGYEATYRNPIEEVQRFFEKFHKNHYKIYNLCPPDERHYPAGSFPNVELIPFDDEGPPCLAQMPEFTRSASSWLNEHPANVVAVHDKAGKGRTGCMIAGLLLKEGICRIPEEALDLFDTKRTNDKQGITMPSQKRYVHYYNHVLHMGRVPMQDYSLDSVTIETDQFKYGLYFELNVVNGAFKACYSSRSSIQNTASLERVNSMNITCWNCQEVCVRRDVIIKFCLEAQEFYERDTVLFQVALNLGFLPPDGIVTLPYADLDIKRADREMERFNPSLQVRLVFSPHEPVPTKLVPDVRH